MVRWHRRKDRDCDVDPASNEKDVPRKRKRKQSRDGI